MYGWCEVMDGVVSMVWGEKYGRCWGKFDECVAFVNPQHNTVCNFRRSHAPLPGDMC